MTTEEQLFSEIKNTLKSYDEAGLIDEITLRNWLKKEIKTFGNDVMVLSDDLIKVEGGKAKLPDDFWTLKEAWKYTPTHYRVVKGSEENARKDSYFRNKVDKNCLTCCEDNCSSKSTFKEEVTFKNNIVDIYYNYPQLLRIREGFRRNAISKDCINLPNKVTKREKNTINILGDTIQTEFNSGSIYLIYRAIPTQDGEVVIPETQHGSLYKYLLSFLTMKALEGLWLNNDDPNLGNKISYLYNQSENYRSRASTELKASVLKPSTWKTLKRTNRISHRKYSKLIPSQNFQ